MTTTLVPEHSTLQERWVRHVWWGAYVLVVGGGLLIAAFARRRVTEPYLGLSLALTLLLLTGWLIRPRVTLYATLLLTAISDQVTVWWFPFVKNLSSRESIAFVADSVTFSPLDLALVTGAAVSVGRRYAHTGTLLAPHPVTRPLLLFTALVVLGFARGLLVGGGDLRIAVLEGRPLFYILLAFVIVVNECTEPSHRRHALWAILVGVVIQSLLSIDYVNGLEPAQREDLDTLNEHGSSLGHNLVIVTLVGLILFRIKRPLVRWALAASLVPVVYVYFIAQRRAGVATLVVAGAMMAIVLLWRRRRTFWSVVPIVTLVLVGYLGAFWNSTSSAGFPAQAIKGIIAPDSRSAEDLSSDLYRWSEAFNLNFTIRTDPIKGLGFGRAFYRPIPLADLNPDFELNAYQPHNSILWIWIKMGFYGFTVMFYLFARAIVLGAARVRRAVIDQNYVVDLTMVLFIVMYALYSYVDVSWDARNTVFLGLAMAICARPTEPGSSTAPEPVRAFGRQTVRTHAASTAAATASA